MHRREVSEGGRRRLLLVAVVAISTLLVASCSSTDPQSSLNPKSLEAQQIDDLWILVLVLGIVVFVVVEGVLVVAMFRFRRRKDDETEPKQTHGNTPLEIAWSIAPAIILAIIAVPTMITLFELRSPAEGDVVVVNVTGHQ